MSYSDFLSRQRKKGLKRPAQFSSKHSIFSSAQTHHAGIYSNYTVFARVESIRTPFCTGNHAALNRTEGAREFMLCMQEDYCVLLQRNTFTSRTNKILNLTLTSENRELLLSLVRRSLVLHWVHTSSGSTHNCSQR